jgi:hypothetical protein
MLTSAVLLPAVCQKIETADCAVEAAGGTAIHALEARQGKAWMPGTIGERSDAVLRTAMAGHDVDGLA